MAAGTIARIGDFERAPAIRAEPRRAANSSVEVRPGTCCFRPSTTMRRPNADDDEGFDPDLLGPTPVTYTYNDALLLGKMTHAELESVRAEMFGEPERVTEPGPQPIAAIDLVRVSSSAPPPRPSAPPRAMTALETIQAFLDADDYAAALARAEALLRLDPTCAEAAHHASTARQMLERLYLAELGDGGDRPRVLLGPAEQRKAKLDRWAAFVISCVDGVSSIEEVTQVTGLARLDTLRILYELQHQGVVRIERRERRPG
jgi:hypothetical protein